MKSAIFFFLAWHILIAYCENTTQPQDDFKCSLPDVKSEYEDIDITKFRHDFSKVSEVKFPGIIGPSDEILTCKIKCIDGNWVGPLCSTSPDGRFQPIFKQCVYHDHPLLLFTFKNLTIENGTNFLHGTFITIRCKEFGLYKLKGDGILHCQNGQWIPKLPECVPTTIITNFTGDAPPTIQYTMISGSASIEPSGELLIFPESSLYLDCIVLHSSGLPQWSWTSMLGQHTSDWSKDPKEAETHFRLTLNKVTARHSDIYTCTSPDGQTNTVSIKVVSVVCTQLNASTSNVIQYAEGARLGQSIHFNCPPGFHLNGTGVITCMGSGLWSDRPPTCIETFCPTIKFLNPHLNLVEYNSSYGGRAIFQCSWGYRLLGTPGIECERNGKWSGEPPSCIPVYCPNPIISENGYLMNEQSTQNNKYLVGDLVTYICKENYQMLGESSIVCTENGFWSHPPPFCVIVSESKKSDTIIIENTTLVHIEE